MKIFFTFIIAISGIFISCNNNKNKEEETDTPGDQKNTSTRDYSIDTSNSYSNLFFDSLVLEKFVADRSLKKGTARRMRSFYNTRNYQFAWFASDGMTEQANAFWNLYDYYLTYSGDSSLNDKELQKTMNNLVLEDDLKVSSNASFTKTELALTQRFIEYSQLNFEKGYVKRKELERFVPVKKNDPMRLADSLLTKKHKDDKYYEDINPVYKLLKAELAKYYDINKRGGWPQIVTSHKTLKAGMAGPEIAQIKTRLSSTGDMAAGDTSQVFDSSLVNGVKNFQKRFGLTPTGTINADLLKYLNVPASNKLKQILVNLERMRWMPTRPAGNLVVVNIPEFMLHMFEGNKKAFSMNVVVGKEGHNTVLFTGDLNQVVFSPYWNIPPSIAKSEIIPAIARNPNYLEKNHMERANGGFRQKPGPWNSLGLVKFLFPNSFNIYFHDTNAKSLFSRDKRAFSHGCIRLKEPKKMAEYLLRHQPEWTSEKIDAAMHAGKEKVVRLKEPIPVFISYYTAWVDENGLNFRDDIYKHDKKMFDRAFVRSAQ
jgi:murein L,D-transpeptidase YcbB/YkuD